MSTLALEKLLFAEHHLTTPPRLSPGVAARRHIGAPKMVPRREEIRYTLYEGGVVRGFTEVQTVHPVTQNPKWGGRRQPDVIWFWRGELGRRNSYNTQECGGQRNLRTL